MKKLPLLLLPLLLIGCDNRAKGFTQKKITSFYSFDPRFEVPLSDEKRQEVLHILAQSYTFLGSGNHTYVFQSEDGKYVIKFFKQKHMSNNIWQNYVPLPHKLFPSRQKILTRRKNEREKSLKSYLLAYQILRENTGIIYPHLTKSKQLNISTHFTDQHGTPFTLKMDNMEFVIQKKAEVGFTHLRTLLEKGEEEKALSAIASLYKIIVLRAQNGIHDRDLQIYKNFGFIDGKAIQIDIGEYRLQTPQLRDDLANINYQFRVFLEKDYPTFRLLFEKQVQEIMQTL